MFYCAEAVLLVENITFSKHSSVIAAFGQHFAKTGRLPQELHISELFIKKGNDHGRTKTFKETFHNQHQTGNA